MAVKILIKRRVVKGKERDLTPLLIDLRKLATGQPGYLSGETLRNLNVPEEYLVISTWASENEWNEWRNKKERQKIQEEIDALLEEKTEYGVYQFSYAE